jgi:type II secretory pathway pseudopilin PulG
MRRRNLRSGKLQITNYKSQIAQRGYMLITLMLMLTLAAMAMLALWPAIGQQIRRDQEEELRHRGTSYMRAIQHFYKKVGRYPTRIEELEETNKVRYLRHRYKDPMSRDPQTGKERDFKILHMQDVNLNNGPVLGSQPGAQPNHLPNSPGSPLTAPTPAPSQPGVGTTSDNPNPSGNPQNPNDAENDNDSEPSTNQPTSPGAQNSPSTSPFSTSPNATSSPQGAGSGFSSTVFGGGPILGVASTSKAITIREFNKKNHYNDWLFIYDPTTDRGGLLVGPWQTLPTSTLPGATPAGSPMNTPNSPFSSSPVPVPPSQNQPPQPPQNQDVPLQQP